MNNTNLTTPPTSTKPSRYISLAGLVTAAAFLVGCTYQLDLGITNTCGEDVEVGLEGAVQSSIDGWYPVTDGSELVLSVDGFDKVLITVVPAGADQIFDHREIDLSYLETTTTNGQELAHLDLATEGLCP